MPTMRERVAELEARRAQVREMGGPDKVAKQETASTAGLCRGALPAASGGRGGTAPSALISLIILAAPGGGRRRAVSAAA